MLVDTAISSIVEMAVMDVDDNHDENG